MSSWTVVWRAIKIIRILYPIVTRVYNTFKGKHPLGMNKHNVARADQVIIKLASKAGLNVGHTEAELVRSAIHYVRAKSDRYKNLKK